MRTLANFVMTVGEWNSCAQ